MQLYIFDYARGIIRLAIPALNEIEAKARLSTAIVGNPKLPSFDEWRGPWIAGKIADDVYSLPNL